jgi:hypothetical protein
MSLDTRLEAAARDLHRSVQHFEPGSVGVMSRRLRARRLASAVALALAVVVLGPVFYLAVLRGGPDVADEPTLPPTTLPSTTVAPTTAAPPTTAGDSTPPTSPSPAGLESPTWTRVPHDEAVFGDPDHGTMIEALALGPGEILAVGTTGPSPEFAWPDIRGTIWSATDLSAWMRGPDDQDAFGVSIDLDTVTYEFRDAASVEGGWVVVGYAVEDAPGLPIWVSTDGSVWTRATGEVLPGEAPRFTGVAGIGSRVVAVGDAEGGAGRSAAVWVSEDGGQTWRPASGIEAAFGGVAVESTGAPGGGALPVDVVATPSGFVAVGLDGSGGDWDAAVWTSPDGLAWSRVPHDEAVFGGPGTQAMIGIEASGPGLVAVGHESLTLDESEPPVAADADRDGAVWVSADGSTWARVPHDEAVFGGDGDQVITGVAAGPAGIVAVGRTAEGEQTSAAVWVSTDGASWARVDDGLFTGPGQGAAMRDVIAVGDRFVAVGWAGVTGDLGSGTVGAVWLAVP